MRAVQRQCSSSTGIVLELELMVLTFVRSLREGNFHLYVETLQNLLPWFFALDQTHYARWLPVHVRDMLHLKSLHPEIHDEFTAGHFTVSKTGRKFSSISIDQAHEQLNALIKGDGGAIGLTDNDSALTRWTTAGPEVVRILQEFEGSVISATDDCQHHEQQHSFQRHFQADVDRFVHTLRDESPFSCLKDREIMVILLQTALLRKVFQQRQRQVIIR